MVIEELHNWKQVIGVAIGSLATIIVAFIGFKGKSGDKEKDSCIEALKVLENKVELLETSLEKVICCCSLI